jgi:hypothetical protein
VALLLGPFHAEVYGLSHGLSSSLIFPVGEKEEKKQSNKQTAIKLLVQNISFFFLDLLSL